MSIFRIRKKRKSKDIAKDRLKLVLINDRANMSPQFLEKIKTELMDVVNKYLIIDENNMDIRISQSRTESGRKSSLLANIPIKSIRK
jgi:cell division topological specificity factor